MSLFAKLNELVDESPLIEDHQRPRGRELVRAYAFYLMGRRQKVPVGYRELTILQNWHLRGRAYFICVDAEVVQPYRRQPQWERMLQEGRLP